MRRNQISSFRRNRRVHLNRGGWGVSSVDYWQASCTHQPAGFVPLVRACVLQSCDSYWLPTPSSRSPFTSPSPASPIAIIFPLHSTPTTHLHYTLYIQPIPFLIHRLTDKFFAHCLPYPNPTVQQTGNCSLADMTNLYQKYRQTYEAYTDLISLPEIALFFLCS
jgi:hypothetical protein